MPTGTLAVVIAKDASISAATRAAVPDSAVVIAADSGVDAARHAGLRVDVAVGDFDSVTAAGLRWATERGADIRRHPTAKDATDLELALDAAVDAGASRLLVLASPGGRLDHALAVVGSLAQIAARGVEVVAELGEATVEVLVGGRTGRVEGGPGDLVSLLALFGPVEGVTTRGLAFPLDGETLPAGTSRGISNVLVGTEATIAVEAGTLLVVRPHRG